MMDLKILNSKYSFWALMLAVLALMIYITPSYGITGDEDIQWKYGHYVWDTISSSKHNTLFDDPKMNESPLKHYGGFFDGMAAMMNDVLKPNDEFLLRHYWNMIFGFLAIVFAGLIGKSMSNSWLVAILSAMFTILTPRFFGEMFNNPKDIPFAAGYIMAIYFLLEFIKNIEKPSWKTSLGLAFGIALAIGVRIGGLLVVAYVGLFYSLAYFLSKDKGLFTSRKALLHIFSSVLIGYLLACVWWPYAWSDVFGNPLESLKIMSSYPLTIFMLFDGMRVNTAEMPSNYLSTWIYIGTPIYILIGTVGALWLFVKYTDMRDRLNLFLLFFALLFPLFYIWYKKSVVYDGLRHILFVLPLMAVLSALFFSHLMPTFTKFKYVVAIGLAILLFLPAKHMIANHPNQYVYFNEFYGGVKKAFGSFETDYYQTSGKLAANWVKNEIKSASTKQSVLSNMGSVYLYFQKEDTSKVYGTYGRWRERDHLDWDYYIAYSRFVEPENLQNNAWPPQNVVHAIKVDDVPVCVVVKRKNKDDIAAYKALEANDFAKSAALYESNLKADASNEYIWFYYSVALAQLGRIDEAIVAIQNAIQLNGSNPDWVEQYSKYNQIKNQMGRR